MKICLFPKKLVFNVSKKNQAKSEPVENLYPHPSVVDRICLYIEIFLRYPKAKVL